MLRREDFASFALERITRNRDFFFFYNLCKHAIKLLSVYRYSKRFNWMRRDPWCLQGDAERDIDHAKIIERTETCNINRRNEILGESHPVAYGGGWWRVGVMQWWARELLEGQAHRPRSPLASSGMCLSCEGRR
jgi:hypothetical protein